MAFAIISVALHMGCEVFTVVNTLGEKQTLKTYFPMLHDDKIGNVEKYSLVDYNINYSFLLRFVKRYLIGTNSSE